MTKLNFHIFYTAEVSCGIPMDGINTEAVPQLALFYGDTYNYSCLSGLDTNDDIMTQCQADGTFTLAVPPTCASKSLRLYVHYVIQQQQ